MRRELLFTIFFLIIYYLLSAAKVFPESKGIYGKIYTEDNEVCQGRIRWDKNEAFWDDVLDAVKTRRSPHGEEKREEEHINIFGLRITWDTKIGSSDASMGINFGHLESVIPLSNHRARLILKSGEKIKVKSAGTDLGSSIREIEIEDENQGKIKLEWDDIDKVIFEKEPQGLSPDEKKRLYGRLTTQDGKEFTGFIDWDTDEVFSTDILDGEEGDKELKIPFNKIKKIERRSSNSASVYLKNGKKLHLSGTNDVDNSINGITVKDPQWGEVEVGWDEFDNVEFLEGGEVYLKDYDDFDGGKRLYGTVRTEDGDSYIGFITWDDDEQYTWEMLDGEYEGLEVTVEFGEIQSIKKESSEGAKVYLKNGNSFILENSNDVNEENKGIYIQTKEGKEYKVDWEDFKQVEFK